jgi:hypothetical protein
VDADRIAVVGLLMGGEEALGAVAADPRIRAIVVEGVSGRGTVADDDLTLPDDPRRWMNIAQSWIQQRLADVLTDASPPLGLREAVVTMAPRPALVKTGREALGGEVTAGRRLRAAAPAIVDLWEVPGAGHIGGLTTRPQQWETRVIRFLDRTLR